MLSSVSIYMKGRLQVSVSVVEKKREWLRLGCHSASSSDALPFCYTLTFGNTP